MDSQDPKNGEGRSFHPPPRPQEATKETKRAPAAPANDEDTANSLFKVLQLIKKHKKNRSQRSLERALDSEPSVSSSLQNPRVRQESDWIQPKFIIAVALLGMMCAAVIGIYRVLQKTPASLNSAVLPLPTPPATGENEPSSLPRTEPPAKNHPPQNSLQNSSILTRPPVIGPRKLPLPAEISRPTTPSAEDAVNVESSNEVPPAASPPPAVSGGEPLDPDLVIDEPQAPGEHVTPQDPAQIKPANALE